MSLEQAIFINNSAVLCMHQGELVKGIEVLRQAVSLLRDLVVSDPRQNGGSQHDLTGLQTGLPSVIMVPLQSECEDEHEENGLMFHHALFLEAESFDAESHEMICACVLYNMALAHHKTAVRFVGENKRCEGMIKKTDKLYQMALGTLDRLTIESPSAELLALGVLNNSAHINSLRYDHARVYSNANVMRHVLDNSKNKANEISAFFAMNAMFYKAYQAAAPAA